MFECDPQQALSVCVNDLWNGLCLCIRGSSQSLFVHASRDKCQVWILLGTNHIKFAVRQKKVIFNLHLKMVAGVSGE